MHLRRQGELRITAAERPDRLLHVGIDIRAIEGRDARFNEARHVVHGLLTIDGPVLARQLPPSLDQPRDVVPRGERDPRHCPGQRLGRRGGAQESPTPLTGDSHAGRAVRIRARDLGIRSHPVV